MTFSLSTVAGAQRATILSGAALATLLCSTSAQAAVYEQLEITGAKQIASEDIAVVCGQLTQIEIDAAEIQAIENCLISTGVFEKVRVTESGQTLQIAVEEIETRPGRVEGGIIWDSEYGLTSRLTYEQYNLIPDAFIAIRSYYSADIKSYELNFYKENGIREGLSFGLEVSGERAKYDDLPYANNADLFEGYVAWAPSEALRMDFGLGYRDHELYAVKRDASALYGIENGDAAAPFTHVTLRYRLADKEKFIGGQLRLEQYLWNLGTDRPVVDTRAEGRLGFALGEKSSAHFSLKGGLVSGRDGYQTSSLDRAYMGGETFRGFAPRGVGPNDAGSILGGNRYLIGSIDLNRELGEVMGQSIEGGVFSDFGSVWGLDNTLGGTIDDSSDFRATLGVSVTFNIGEVPISLYVAKPVEKSEGDIEQLFGLSASTRF